MRTIVLSIALAFVMLAGNLVWPESADARPRRWARWYGGMPARYYYRPYYAYPRYYANPYQYSYRYWSPGYYWY